MRQHSGKKRLGAVLLSLALCLGLLPTAALAAEAESVTYIDADGKPQTCATATVVEEDYEVTWSSSGEGGAWYVVNSDVTISERITVTGNVHLILADDCTLTASDGITVSSGNSLTIYGQSGGTGAVTATADSSDAGIGGGRDSSGDSDDGEACGTVTINGGNVTATGNDYGAGIGGGGGDVGGSGATVTINGGVVKASGSSYGAGIGGGGGGTGGAVGTFSTGENGNAVIFAQSGENAVSISNTSGLGSWQGAIFQGNVGQVYGSVTLSDDAEIPDGYTLTVPSGTSLTVPEDVTLTNKGTILLLGGTFSGNVTGNQPCYPTSVSVSFSKDGKSVTSVPYGSTVTITAKVTSGSEAVNSGTVTFYRGEVNDSNKLNEQPVAVTSGSATHTISALNWTPSDYTITAAYSGVEGADGGYGLAESSNTVTLTVSKAEQAAPSAPTLSSRTSTSITLNEITTTGQGGVEYGYTTGGGSSENIDNWQTDTEFTDLTAATAYTFYARYAGNDCYEPSPASSPGLEVTTERADSTLKVETSSTTLTYGETLTITVTPEQTAANGINALTTETGTVELKKGDTVLASSIDVDDDGSYTLTYDTKNQDLSIGDNTLTVSYGGSSSLKPSTAEVTVTLEKKNVTATLEGTTSKTYDGTTAAPAGLTIALTGVLEGNEVTAAGTIAYDTKDVGDNKTITASNLTLTGADAGYYNLMSNDIKENTGSITAAALGGTVTITGTAQYGQQLTASYDPVHEEEAVSYQWNRNGEIISGATSATYTLTAEDAGQTITVTATAVDSNHTGSVTSAPVTVEVTQYTPPANPNYRVDIPTPENGTITANPAAAKAGTEVTLTVTPEEGYEVGDVTVTDRFGDAVEVTANPDGTYTFTMPNGQVTVEVTFVESQPEPLPFTDVAESDWFYDAVRYAYENGLMGGIGDNLFAPNSPTTRAQLVTILYRLEGEPAVTGQSGFTDVEADTWYTDAVTWAAEEGVVNGVSATQFAPGNNFTREQLATILFRYAQAKGYDVSSRADLSGFPDAGDILPYAQEAMAWAVAEGLLQGFEDDTLRPQGNATRAQIATILMRFCQTVAQ